MKIIRACSYKCADNLTKQLSENNEKRRLYYYSFQIIIGGIVKLLLLTAIALLTGSFIETFTVLAFYAGFRIVAGGYHMNDYTNCMITSFAIFIGLGFITKYTQIYWNTTGLVSISISAFIIALITAIRYAPADTPFKPMDNVDQRRRLKKLSIVETFIWISFDLYLIYKGYTVAALAGSLGMIMAAFIISPAGYSFFDFISGKMHKLRKHASSS